MVYAHRCRTRPSGWVRIETDSGAASAAGASSSHPPFGVGED